MTYDITLMKNGKEFPTPMIIHGMGYGAKRFNWARPFIHADYKMELKEVMKQGKEFHELFIEYCKTIQHDGATDTYFGGDPKGYYYDSKKLTEDSITKFEVCFRWLQVYLTAMAFGCDIHFH